MHIQLLTIDLKKKIKLLPNCTDAIKEQRLSVERKAKSQKRKGTYVDRRNIK